LLRPNRALRRKPERCGIENPPASQEAVAQAINANHPFPSVPGWWREGLLRLSNDVGQSPRYSARFSSRRDFEKRLDVVKDRVTSPKGAGDREFESHLVHQ